MSDTTSTIAEPLKEEISIEERVEIEKLRRQLRRKSYPFLNFLRVAEGDVCEEDTFDSLMNMLQEPKDTLWKERTMAASIVGMANLSAEKKRFAAQTLGYVLKNPQAVKRSRIPARLSRTLVRSMLLMALVGVGGGILGALFAEPSGDLELNTLGILLILLIAAILGGVAGSILGAILSPLFLPLWLAVDNSRSDRVRAAAATALGRLRQPETVGALALGNVEGNARIRRASAHALMLVLPTLTPEYYGQLEADAVPNMIRALEQQEAEEDPFPEERMLDLALMEALGKVGDGRAVRIVQILAEEGMTSEIREAATHLLPTLLERQRQEQNQKMLLRGASMPSTLPTHLLRPASNRVSEPPEVLLRPTAESDDRLAGS